MRLFSAVKEKFEKVGERVEASLDKHKDKVQGLAIIGGTVALTIAACTGNASAAGTTGANDIYGGMTIVDAVLVGIGSVAMLASLYLRDFRVALIAIIMIVMGAGAYYLGF
jgi:hypothetical protein